jgi:hypothetical protein
MTQLGGPEAHQGHLPRSAFFSRNKPAVGEPAARRRWTTQTEKKRKPFPSWRVAESGEGKHPHKIHSSFFFLEMEILH